MFQRKTSSTGATGRGAAPTKKLVQVVTTRTIVTTTSKPSTRPGVTTPSSKVSTTTTTQQHQAKKSTTNGASSSSNALARPPLPNKTVHRSIGLSKEKEKERERVQKISMSPVKRKATVDVGSPVKKSSSHSAAAEAHPPLKKLKKAASSSRQASASSSSLSSASSSEEEEASLSDRDDSSDDDDSEAMRKRQSTPVVERDVYGPESNEPGEKARVIEALSLVMNTKAAYRDWFLDPSDPKKSTLEWSGSEVPTIDLEYPGAGSERFPLLAPKNDQEYDPIDDVMTVIRTVLDIFLTPAQSLALFGYTPGLNPFSAFLSAPSSRSATPGTPTESSSTVHATSTLPPLMRQLEKAKAKRDGPSFLASIERYNAGLKELKASGAMKSNIQSLKGLKEKTWTKIAAQSYDRAVGPELEELSKYEAFSDNVYGELLPRFMSEIFQKTNLGPNSVFVDLGSGVGNCVVQAALATGCEAWGFENMAHASSLARAQLVEAEQRHRLWGVRSGAMQVVEADFCEHPTVGEVLKRADVILVNNEVFSSNLNQRLSLLFLDLQSNTRIVSLKAFAHSFTLTAHNRHSPLAILDQGPPLSYGRKSVSWKEEGGKYFIGKIDREKVARFDEKERRRKEKIENKIKEMEGKNL